MQFPGLKTDAIYLPAENVDPRRWSVVACDQYTSQPEYWRHVAEYVGDFPSTLHIVQPEVDLDLASAHIPAIHAAMHEYLADGTLVCRVQNGFTLTERTTSAGTRPGLVAAIDLEQYDFTPGSNAMIRATEGTICERIPPRMRIREGAVLETPHVMLLLDDPECTVIEPAAEALRDQRPMFDFDLMGGGGHLCVKGIEGAALEPIAKALNALWTRSNGFLYAVGDGNHSLATAKTCWAQIKRTLSAQEAENHPARYALAEIVNLHSPALQFEPIHRVIFNANSDDLTANFRAYLAHRNMNLLKCDRKDADLTIGTERYRIQNAEGLLPLAVLQPFLDRYIAENEGLRIDYVHGESAVKAICAQGKAVGILLGAIQKSSLFPSVRACGVLPRKTFSMGRADEKRYYMECRKIL